MTSLADDLIDTGNLAVEARDDFVKRVNDAAREGSFNMELTMFGVIARRPPDRP